MKMCAPSMTTEPRPRPTHPVVGAETATYSPPDASACQDTVTEPSTSDNDRLYSPGVTLPSTFGRHQVKPGIRRNTASTMDALFISISCCARGIGGADRGGAAPFHLVINSMQSGRPGLSSTL